MLNIFLILALVSEPHLSWKPAEKEKRELRTQVIIRWWVLLWWLVAELNQTNMRRIFSFLLFILAHVLPAPLPTSSRPNYTYLKFIYVEKLYKVWYMCNVCIRFSLTLFISSYDFFFAVVVSKTLQCCVLWRRWQQRSCCRSLVKLLPQLN